jgi:hypothetical protein
MALLAAVALANAGGPAPAVHMVFSVLVAIAATMLSALLLRLALSMREARHRQDSRKLAPIPIRDEKRPRRRARR